MSLEIDSAYDASSSLCLSMPHPNERWSRTHVRTSKVCDELLAYMILCPHWALSASTARTWPRSQIPSLLRPPMPSFPPAVRWHVIALSINVLTVRVLHDDELQQYRPANKKHQFWVSLRFLFCWPNARPFSDISGFLSAEGFESRYFCTYISNEYFLLTAVILKGSPMLRMRRGAGCGSRNEDSRHQPPATDYVETCRGVHLRCFYHKGKKQ